jgi:hypothetical protein
MADSDINGSPVRDASVVTGMPKLPNATGVVLNNRVYTIASSGSKLVVDAFLFSLTRHIHSVDELLTPTKPTWTSK